MIQPNFFDLLRFSILALLLANSFGCGVKIKSFTNPVMALTTLRPPSNLSDGLALGDHRIFITTNPYGGIPGDGLADADAFCQTTAASAGLTRNYKAVLSDATANAVDRITSNGGSVYTFDTLGVKKVVFNSVPEMWSAPTINQPIYSETSADMSGSAVITGSNTNGTYYPEDCSGIGGPTAYGYGNPNDTYTQLLPFAPWFQVHSGEGTWLHDFNHGGMPPIAEAPCFNPYPVYCISQ
ncbi:MAG: hypothetical protein H7301_01460 [Cryobacterium sp.]|nr:hypothetical protein [Oligoflexia bacterium]